MVNRPSKYERLMEYSKTKSHKVRRSFVINLTLLTQTDIYCKR